MPINIPPTLAELNECKKTILQYMQHVQTVADFSAKELHTLKAALDHVDQLINELVLAGQANDTTPDLPTQKSAA